MGDGQDVRHAAAQSGDALASCAVFGALAGGRSRRRRGRRCLSAPGGPRRDRRRRAGRADRPHARPADTCPAARRLIRRLAADTVRLALWKRPAALSRLRGDCAMRRADFIPDFFDPDCDGPACARPIRPAAAFISIADPIDGGHVAYRRAKAARLHARRRRPGRLGQDGPGRTPVPEFWPADQSRRHHQRHLHARGRRVPGAPARCCRWSGSSASRPAAARTAPSARTPASTWRPSPIWKQKFPA